MKKLSCIVTTLMLTISAAFAGGNAAEMLPADTTTYLTVNFSNISKNKLVQGLLADARMKPFRAEMEKILPLPLANVSSATLSSPEDGEILLAHLEVTNAGAMVATLEKEPTYTTVTSGSRTIHCWTVEFEKALGDFEKAFKSLDSEESSLVEKMKEEKLPRRQPGFLVVEKDALIIFSTDLRTLNNALEVLDKRKPSLAANPNRALDLPPADAGIFVFGSFNDAKNDLKLDSLNIRKGTLSCGERKGDLYIQAVLGANQNTELQQVKAVIDGVKAMFQLSLGAATPQLAEMLNAFSSSIENNVLKIEWSYPVAKLEQGLNQAVK